MSVILGLVILTVLAALGAGLISILVPLKFMGIRTRGRGAMIAFISAAAIVGLSYLIPSAPEIEIAQNQGATSVPDDQSSSNGDTAPTDAEPTPQEPTLRILRPDEAQGVNIELAGQSGQITSVQVTVEEGNGIDRLGTLATIAANIPRPGIARSTNISLVVDQSYLLLDESNEPPRQMEGQIWLRHPDGDPVWRGSAFTNSLGGQALNQERFYADWLRENGEDPYSPTDEGSRAAIEATQSEFNLPETTWPLYSAGALIAFDSQTVDDALQDAGADSAWQLMLEAALEPVCSASQACVYATNIQEFGPACRRAIEEAVLTDHDWRFLDSAQDRFNRFGFGNSENTTLRLAGDRLRVQNVFGTWVDHIYLCEVDIRSGSIINVGFEPG